MFALKEVTDPYLLGAHLGIKTRHLKKIKLERHQQCIERVKIEVIRYWLGDINANCSWETLADAVKCMGCHGNVVDSLKRKSN